jgi:hypothetical protein
MVLRKGTTNEGFAACRPIFDARKSYILLHALGCGGDPGTFVAESVLFAYPLNN